MTEDSKLVLRANKISHIISSICDLHNLSLQEATDIYYRSTTSDLIEEGVSELQCRSDKYLANLVWDEFIETQKEKDHNNKGGCNCITRRHS